MKPTVKIHRIKMDETGCISEVDIDDLKIYGMEQPWRNNKSSISCIPDGQYILVPHESGKYGNTWAFVGGTVSHYRDRSSSRYACLIHAGNTVSDVKGCLAVGLDWTTTPEGNLFVSSSRKAMTALKEKLDTNKWYHAEINSF